MKIFIILIITFFLFPLIGINAECLEGTQDGDVCLSNPIKGDLSFQELIGKVINTVLGVTGSLALIMFIYGGFLWMTSGGSAEKVTKGKNTLVWAALGLAVIFSSYAIVNFVIRGVSNTPEPTTNSGLHRTI